MFFLSQGGAAVMTSVTNDISVEYATVLVTTVIGAYTLIGGLGATFYVSYFNTAIIYVMLLIFVMKVYNDDSDNNTLGMHGIYICISFKCKQILFMEITRFKVWTN